MVDSNSLNKTPSIIKQEDNRLWATLITTKTLKRHPLITVAARTVTGLVGKAWALGCHHLRLLSIHMGTRYQARAWEECHLITRCRLTSQVALAGLHLINSLRCMEDTHHRLTRTQCSTGWEAVLQVTISHSNHTMACHHPRPATRADLGLGSQAIMASSNLSSNSSHPFSNPSSHHLMDLVLCQVVAHRLLTEVRIGQEAQALSCMEVLLASSSSMHLVVSGLVVHPSQRSLSSSSRLQIPIA